MSTPEADLCECNRPDEADNPHRHTRDVGCELWAHAVEFRAAAVAAERRMVALRARLADVPRWLEMNGMDPQSVGFVRINLEAALTEPPEDFDG